MLPHRRSVLSPHYNNRLLHVESLPVAYEPAGITYGLGGSRGGSPRLDTSDVESFLYLSMIY
jgi:hypothetical protein